MRLIDADALKEDLRQYFTDGVLDGISARLAFNQILHDIDNAPTVEPDVGCYHCDYFKFSKSFIENVVKFMADYKIESVEDLMKELNHINEWLGGKADD